MNSRIAAFSIFDKNYYRKASVCLRSFSLNHPNVAMFALDISDEFVTDALPVRLLPTTSIGLDEVQLANMAKMFSVTEFSTALKPWAIETLLLNEGFETVIYLDPDLYWLCPIPTTRLSESDGFNIRLTPHILEPPTLTPALSLESIANAGAFNLGFGIFHRSSLDFVNLWRNHVSINAVTAPDRGRFTDQRFMDFAPSLTRTEVIRDPGYNVAYWNLHERKLSMVGSAGSECYSVNGESLTFFHFSGFDEWQPYRLTKHKVLQPTLHLESEAVLSLINDYSKKVHSSGTPGSLKPDGYNKLNREDVLPRELGLALSLALDEVSQTDGSHRALNLLGSPNLIRKLMATPESASSPISRVGRILWSVRPDLQFAFPQRDSREYRNWLSHNYPACFGSDVGLEREALTPRGSGVQPESNASTLIVSIGAKALGISAIADQVEMSLESSAISHLRLKSPHHDAFDSISVEEAVLKLSEPHELTIWCMNPNSLPESTIKHLISQDTCSSRVAIWWWELETPPSKWRPFLTLFDEVWTLTPFVHHALSKLNPTKVRLAPLALKFQSNSWEATYTDRSCRTERVVDFVKASKAHGKFVVLTKLDFLSSFDRKGLMFAIRAFQESLGANRNCILVIKSTNASAEPRIFSDVAAKIFDSRNIFLFDETLSARGNADLYSFCDVFLSLHRSEGLGLNILEAVAAGIPTIATSYGGFTDLLREEDYISVPFSMAPVEDVCRRYEPTGHWATPDLLEASRQLSNVYSNVLEAKNRAKTSSSLLGEKLQLSTIAFRSFVKDRSAFLRKRNSLASGSQSPNVLVPVSDPARVSANTETTDFEIEKIADILEEQLVDADFDNNSDSRGVLRSSLRRFIRRLTKSNREFARHVAKQAILISQSRDTTR